MGMIAKGKRYVAGVILVRDGRVLLQQRDDDPEIAYPGHWAIFGGHLEDGETPEECALREIEEELGLRLEGPLALVYHRDTEEVERSFFSAPLVVPVEDLTLTEGQGMTLIGIDEFDDYRIVPLHRAILEEHLGR